MHRHCSFQEKLSYFGQSGGTATIDSQLQQVSYLTHAENSCCIRLIFFGHYQDKGSIKSNVLGLRLNTALLYKESRDLN